MESRSVVLIASLSGTGPWRKGQCLMMTKYPFRTAIGVHVSAAYSSSNVPTILAMYLPLQGDRLARRLCLWLQALDSHSTGQLCGYVFASALREARGCS